MSKILTKDTFNEKLYNTLPQLYHTQDSMVNYSLKRYLNVLVEGGFSKVIEESNGLLDLNDPNKTPAEVLPIVFKQYGLEVFNGLPEMYLRKLLPILGDLYARKGATTVIEYLTSIISDVKTEAVLSDDFLNDYHIDLRLEMDYDQEGARDLPDKEQLMRIVKEFLPFFVSVTPIYVYMFYEFGDVHMKDEDILFRVKEVLNDSARFVSHKGSGFFPTLNNLDLGLNSDVILNETYYYDVDVDWNTDNIITSILETGTFDSTKSRNYFRPVLNEELKTLNGSFVLNDFIDTDELVSTNIAFTPAVDLVKFKALDILCDTVKDHFEDDTVIHGVEKSLDKFVNVYYEEATFRSDKSTEFMKGILNNVLVRLNDNFILNEGVDVDWYEDKVGLEDRTSLVTEENRAETLIIGEEIYYASLNTGYVLNKDFLTNEGHKDIGNIVSKDSVKDFYNQVSEETGNIDKGYDNQIMAFLNVSECVLNTMLLNNIPEYVKITIHGETQVRYPTMFGLM